MIPLDRVGPVLVTLDGSSEALSALPVATELATVLAAKAHIIYVGERELTQADMPDAIGIGRDQLDRFIVEQVVGEAAAGILDAAHDLEAAVIVTCTHSTRDGTSVPERELGPVAEHIAAESACPVVLVNPARGLAPWRVEEILLPYDGTPSTASALGPAATLAKRAGSHLFVVYVAEDQTSAPSERGALTMPRYVDQPQHEWPAWAGEFLDRLNCVSDFDVSHVRLFVAHGHPGCEIVRLARERGIDLIVVAWKGIADPARGTTAKVILREAPCPVLVLRTEPSEDASPCRRA